jgi:hypothetical protein
MSWVFMVSLAVLLAAIVLIEYRAIRAGDERRHHAPGYTLVLGGLIMIGVGIAAAASEQAAPALLASMVGLGAVVIGASRGREAAAH